MLKATNALLNQFGLDVVSEARANAPSTTGALANSLDYKVTIENDEIKVEFFAEEYGAYQDQGVQGKDPSRIKGGYQKAPMSPFKFGSGSGNGSLRGGIDKWVVRKGLDGVRDAKGRFIPRKSMVYLISRSIYFTGIRPTLFFTSAFDRQAKELLQKVERALELDYEKQLKEDK